MTLSTFLTADNQSASIVVLSSSHADALQQLVWAISLTDDAQITDAAMKIQPQVDVLDGFACITPLGIADLEGRPLRATNQAKMCHAYGFDSDVERNDFCKISGALPAHISTFEEQS